IAAEPALVRRDLLEIPAEETLHVRAVPVWIGVAPQPAQPLQGLVPEAEGGDLLRRLLSGFGRAPVSHHACHAEAGDHQEEDDAGVGVHAAREAPPGARGGPTPPSPPPSPPPPPRAGTRHGRVGARRTACARPSSAPPESTPSPSARDARWRRRVRA